MALQLSSWRVYQWSSVLIPLVGHVTCWKKFGITFVMFALLKFRVFVCVFILFLFFCIFVSSFHIELLQVQ